MSKVKERSWGSIADWVNIVLAGAVIFLSWLTYTQTTVSTEAAVASTKATIKADSIATEALRLSQLQYQTSIQNEEDARVEATKKGIEDERKYRQQFGLDSMSTRAQIDAFKKEADRFDIENEPYMQFDSLVNQVFAVGQPVIFSIYFKNLGKYPVKIVEAAANVVIAEQKPDTSNTIYGVHLINIATPLISPVKPEFITIKEAKNLDMVSYDNLMQVKSFFWIYGYCKYKNIINKKVKVYYYMAKASPTSNVIELIYF